MTCLLSLSQCQYTIDTLGFASWGAARGRFRKGHCCFAVPIGTAKRNTSAKQCYVLRDPHLRFGSYTVEIIITFCVKLLRCGLSSYVL